MNRIEQLQNLVNQKYSKAANADSWIDWGYPNHVLKVAEIAETIAKRFNASVEYAVAGALLHDIADAEMARGEKGHEERSEQIAIEMLAAAGFNSEEQHAIVHDIIAPHSCSEQLPQTLEAKTLATADALAHLQTDFYLLFCWRHYGAASNNLSYEEYKEWVKKRLEKDYHRKIQFEEIRTEAQPDYEAIKSLFNR